MSQADAPVPFKQRLGGWLLGALMRLLYLSSRKRYTGREVLLAHFADGRRFVLCAWHNRNLMAPFGYLAAAPTGRVFRPLASASRDGTLAALAMKALGVRCIRGSSSRGGAQALREMLRAAKQGSDLGITPDGPRGPVYEVQPGVVAAAQLTGLPIIPMSVQARRRKELRSWDRMIVPKPFTTLHYAWGEPIQVPRELDAAGLEHYRQRVEVELRRLDAWVEKFDQGPVGDGR